MDNTLGQYRGVDITKGSDVTAQIKAIDEKYGNTFTNGAITPLSMQTEYPLNIPSTQPSTQGLNALMGVANNSVATAMANTNNKTITGTNSDIISLINKFGTRAEATAQAEADAKLAEKKALSDSLENQILQADQAHKKEIDALYGTGTRAFSIPAITESNRLYASQAADRAIAYSIANRDYNSAAEAVQRKIDAEFEGYKDQIVFLQNVIAENKRLSDVDRIALEHKNRMEEANYSTSKALEEYLGKAKLDAAFKDPSMAGKFMGIKSLDELSNIYSSMVTSYQPSEKVAGLMGTMNLLDEIEKNAALNTRVGTNIFSRKPIGFLGRVGAGLATAPAGAAAGAAAGAPFAGIGAIPGAIFGGIAGFAKGALKGTVDDVTGAGQAFAGSVHQLTSQSTLNQLLELKAAGGTLGALSDQERIMLQNAATKLNDWEIKTGSGENRIGTGVWNIDEKNFLKELNTLKTLTRSAIERAGGYTDLTQEDYQQIQGLIGSSYGGFDAANYYR